MSWARRIKMLMASIAVTYGLFALRYYYTQTHVFDPFTQMPLSSLPIPLPPKARGQIRILALGGSTTEDSSLLEPMRYPSVLRQLLAAAYPQLQIEVFNAGRDWFTTRHSLIAYVTYYQAWQPDIVVMLDGINDLSRSFSPPAYAIGNYDALYSHYYGAAANGAQPPTFEQYLYRLWAGPLATEYWYEAPFVQSVEVDYPVSRYQALPSFEGNLSKLIGAVRWSGAQPVLVTQASLYKPAMTREERKALWFGRWFCATRVGFARYEYPTPESLARALAAFNEGMRTIARREGVTLIDGDGAIPKSLEMFEDDCHHTPEGARRLAVAVANGIRAAGLLLPAKVDELSHRQSERDHAMEKFAQADQLAN